MSEAAHNDPMDTSAEQAVGARARLILRRSLPLLGRRSAKLLDTLERYDSASQRTVQELIDIPGIEALATLSALPATTRDGLIECAPISDDEKRALREVMQKVGDPADPISPCAAIVHAFPDARQPYEPGETADALSAIIDLQVRPGGGLCLNWSEPRGARGKSLAPADLTGLRALADAVSRAETAGKPAAIAKTRLTLSSALFDLLDDPDDSLARRIARADAERRRINVYVRIHAASHLAFAEHPAIWMRWDLLPLAGSRRRDAPRFFVILQFESQNLGMRQRIDVGDVRILFMASSPVDTPPELDVEREEQEELAASLAPFAGQARTRIRFVEDGTLEALSAALLVEYFDVVHLTGHGTFTPDGPRLIMEDAFGGSRLVSAIELIGVLERAKGIPNLVMLSCCPTAEASGSVARFAAELVGAGVPNVLAWERPVRDNLTTLPVMRLCCTPIAVAQLDAGTIWATEGRTLTAKHSARALQLVGDSAMGVRFDDAGLTRSEDLSRNEVHKYLGRRIRVPRAGFVGRRRLVQRISRILLRGQDDAREVAGACVWGIMGVGKSCAVGYAIDRIKQHQPELGVVILQGTIDEGSVLEAFKESASTYGMDETAKRLLDRTDEPVLRRVRRTMEHWHNRPVIVVLDEFEQNLERRSDGPWLVKSGTAALLETLLPTCSTGRPKLLITSTVDFRVPGTFGRAVAFIPLGALDAASVRKLWLRGQPFSGSASESLKIWVNLAERLGRNARMLTWARALLTNRTDGDIAEVAARAAAELPLLVPGDDSSQQTHVELAELFLRRMARDHARASLGEDALAFVKRARVFDAAVPTAYLVSFAEGLAIDVDRDLDALASWGLLEVGELDGGRAYRVSPLVEPKLDVDNPTRWHEAASKVWEALTEDATDAAVELERVQAAWEHALRAGKVERADRLARRIDAALHNAGLHTKNLRLAERHLEALPESPFGYQWAGFAEYMAGRPGPLATERVRRGVALLILAHGTEEHRDVAASLHELGGVCMAQGDLNGARYAIERSLAIWSKVLGTEAHHSLATSLHALGGVLLAQGDLGGARRAIERSLMIWTEVFGTEAHPNVAISLNELGRVLMTQGNFDHARRVIEHSLKIWINVHGTEEHPNVADSLHALGGVLLSQGDLDGARHAIEHSLEIKNRLLGTDDHPDVAASLHALGGVLIVQGDLGGARLAIERSLAIKTKVHGTEEHPSVAASLHALGGVLMGLGDLAGARRAIEHSLAITAKVHGTEEHPDIAASLHELGRVLMAQGDLNGARQAIERSLAITAKVHGTDEHPNVASSLHALAGVLVTQGDVAGARHAIERSLAIETKVLSTEEHPNIATSLHALSGILRAQGDLAGARSAIERSLAIKAKVFGTDVHPDIAASLHRLGGVLMAQGDLGGARDAFEQSLAITLSILGDEHPDVATTFASLGTVLVGEKRFEEAIDSYRRALAIRDKCFGTRDHYMSAETEVSLAMLLFHLGQADEARELLGHAMRVLAEQVPDHPIVQQLRVIA